MRKKGVCIIMTDQCNASCQICCFRCSPSNRNVIDETLMLQIIDQAKEHGNVEYIGFSGGEPFLYYELLKTGLDYAHKSGFKTSVATNGFWGKWSDDVLSTKLAELPIDQMTISTDYYHQQYIPEADLQRAIVAVKRLKINLKVGIGETKSGKSTGEHFKELGSYKYLMSFYTYPFVRAGRAKELPYEDFYRYADSKNLKCNSNGLISVRYDGEVFPCCEQMVFDTVLSLGNIKNKALSEILSASNNNAFFTVLMSSDGFNNIAKIAENKFGFVLPEACASSCEICHMLFEKSEMMEELLPYIEDEFERIAVSKLLNRQ